MCDVADMSGHTHIHTYIHTGPRGPQLVVCVYEISKSDEYNESRDTDYENILLFIWRPLRKTEIYDIEVFKISKFHGISRDFNDTCTGFHGSCGPFAQDNYSNPRRACVRRINNYILLFANFMLLYMQVHISTHIVYYTCTYTGIHNM